MEAEEDCRDRHRLMDLIEEATVSPEKSLDLGLLQSIKSLVRSSDSNVRTAFDALFDKLKKNHSQVRFLAVLLIDELFTRSKLFRSLLVPKFEMFMLLTIGYRDDYPLPKPPDRATLLRTTGMELVEKWNDSFGLHYKQVRLGFEYLKKTLRLQFPNLRAAAALAEQQRQEKVARTQALIQKKYESLCQEFSELRAEIQLTLSEIAECCKILEPEIVSAPEGNKPVLEADLESLVFGDDGEYAEYGDSSLRRQLHEEVLEEVAVSEKPKETTDNSAVFETLRDLFKLVASNHLTTTQEWLSILMRVDTSDAQPRDALLKEVIDLRTQLLGSLGKCESLGIDRTERASRCKSAMNEVDDEDIIWEAGDGGTDQDETASTSKAVNTENDSKKFAPRYEDLASSSAVILFEDKMKEKGTGPRAELLEKAPVLPYGSFLDNWGSTSNVPANQRGLEMDNHWGRFDGEAMIPVEKVAEMNVRASFYKAPEREIMPCRALLKKGGLCPRRDLHRCPLHGPIIQRDENGYPVQTSEIAAVESKPAEKEPVKDFPEVSVGGIHSGSSSSMGAPSSAAEVELAMQAIANVRERDEAEAKKKRDERAMIKRSQFKRDREHNDTVLRAAALSQSDQGFQKSFGEDFDDDVKMRGGKKRARCGLTALLKKTPSAKERIAQRLLNSRVRENVVNEITRVEEARHRDAAANQW